MRAGDDHHAPPRAPRRADRYGNGENHPARIGGTPRCPTGKTWNGANCEVDTLINPGGSPQDGSIIDQDGNVQQDNGGGE